MPMDIRPRRERRGLKRTAANQVHPKKPIDAYCPSSVQKAVSDGAKRTY
jgi:hypothetical protein